MDQRTFENKVKELAEKLKSSGVVTSDSMAKNMAQDIITTEESTREKYEQPKQSPSQQSTQEQSTDKPRNMVVEEAIKNAQGSPHQARIGAEVDQSKSIAELLEEDTEQKVKQPRITLDNPVVENGVARKEKETEPTDFGIKQTPPEARGSGAPIPKENPTHPKVQQAVQQTTAPQPEPATSAAPEPVEPSTPQEPKNAESNTPEEPKKEEKPKDDRPEVDLSEMFNFSKK
jgi:hypothetical protein